MNFRSLENMPILVQWKWKERTKSFLVIFHFDDDYSKTNLRMNYVYSVTFPVQIDKSRRKAIMTWAPSHIELGMLGEILRYANIINGLNRTEKRELKDKLQGTKAKWEEKGEKDSLLKDIKEIYEKAGIEFLSAKPNLDTKEWEFIIELCPNYIDYLKKILNPYLKD